SLAGLELFGNRTNRRGLEPVTENRCSQRGHTGILEAVGAVFRSNDLLKPSFLTRTDRPHSCHSTGWPIESVEFHLRAPRLARKAPLPAGSRSLTDVDLARDCFGGCVGSCSAA